jgi:dienelactone hydrolase
MFARIVGALLAIFIAGTVSAQTPGVGSFAGERAQLVAISPSGNLVAIVVSTGGRKGALKIARLTDSGLQDANIINLGEVPVGDVAFKSDDRLIVTVYQEDVDISGFRRKDGEGRPQFDRPVVISMPPSGEGGLVLLPDSGPGAEVHALLPDDPEHVILETYNVNNAALDLVKVNILTGESEVVEMGRGTWSGASRNRHYTYTVGWETTPAGQTYLRFDYDEASKVRTVYGRVQGGDWVRLRKYAIVDGQQPVQFNGLASPTSVYVVDRAGGDKKAIWEYDLRTGQPIRAVMAPPQGEALGTRLDPYTGALNGMTYITNGVIKTSFTNKALASAQAALDEAFSDQPIRWIADYSRDRGMIIVRTEGPSQPPSWHLLDVRRMELATLATTPGLPSNVLGPVETIIYPSSDGRQIVAYLTLPPGGVRKGLPVVVMPHGGPEAQDTLTFEGWRQYLATQGYAVFQPQFRGSDGFGLAHEVAGHGTWGTLVQDDVRFGVAKLVADGIADPSRMCIFGWSYGGYMALAGATLSPDLYRCAIAGAGVADVNAMLAWERQTAGGDSETYQYWAARMGDVEVRKASSPANFAADVKIPVLLIHGEDDGIVPIEQSEIMEAALKKAGKEVTFLRYKRQQHSFRFGEESEALTKIAEFLAKYLSK